MISLQEVLSALASKVRFNVCSFGYIQWCLWLIGLSLGSSVGRANIIYVNGRASLSPPPDGLSWATAFTNVKNALSLAAVGDEVWVAAGNYTNNSTLSLKSGVALYGGFLGTETNLNQRNGSAHTTMLTASQYNVVTIMGGTNETRVDGVTITGSGGSGIYGRTPSLVIANNRIVGNQKSGIDCSGALIMITNNVIAGNGPRLPGDSPITGGGISISGYPASILNNVIAGNSALAAGGIYCGSGTVLMAGNTIVGNESTMDGGGIVCRPGTHRIIGNRIFNNIVRQPRGSPTYYGGGGLSILGGASLTIANNLFMNNAAIGLTNNMNGGGIRCDAASSANIINNTLISNRADRVGGAIYLEATNQVVLANNLVSSNSSGITATTHTVFSHKNKTIPQQKNSNGLLAPHGPDAASNRPSAPESSWLVIPTASNPS